MRHPQRPPDRSSSKPNVATNEVETLSASATDENPSRTSSRDRTGRDSRWFSLELYEVLWIVGIFAGFAVLAFLFPPNGDDWAWGSQVGIARLDTFFENYNGRYAANLVVLALTRLPVLSALIVGAVMAAIVYLIVDISENRNMLGYSATTALLLLMPNSLWRQTISWLSGFTNYTVSALFVLIFLSAAKRRLRHEPPARLRLVRRTCILLFAFGAALFMETVTIFLVIASMVLIVLQRRTSGRILAESWCWLGGSIAGAAVMFSNGAYRNALTESGSHDYQKVSGLSGLPTKIFDLISRFAVVDNIALNVALGAAMFALGYWLLRNQSRVVGTIALVFTTVFIGVAVPLHLSELASRVELFWRSFAGIAVIALIIALCGIVALAVKSAERRSMLVAVIASGVLLVGPLLAVSPIGPRNFFVTYVLFIIIINILLLELSTKLGDQMAPGLAAGISAICVALTIGLASNFGVVYAAMTTASNNRLDQIRSEVADGKTTVSVEKLPSQEYTHMPDPTSGIWETRYKLYYGLPKNLKIELVP